MRKLNHSSRRSSTRRFIVLSILTSLIHGDALAGLLKVSITRNACTPPWDICHRPSLSDNNYCCRQSSWWAKHEGKLIFAPSGPKTARVSDLQSIFATVPEAGPGEFF